MGTVCNEILDIMVWDSNILMRQIECDTLQCKTLQCDTLNATFLNVELVLIPPRSLPGFKKCHATDIVQNFFIARTLTAGTIRFDGLFKRIAHREYFLDAIGKLRIAVW